jgi:hypothetical protein
MAVASAKSVVMADEDLPEMDEAPAKVEALSGAMPANSNKRAYRTI